MKDRKLLLILFLILSINLFAQSKWEVDREAITKILYQHGSDDIPGMAVGVVKEGKVVYEQYLGYANLEHKVRINKDTRFNIASDAKQFTALYILKLIDEGRIKLEDDIRKYLPELYTNIEEKIAISNLISHTSGIRDYGYLIGLTGKTAWKLFIDNEDVITLLRDQKSLNFEPGTAYLYSNSNYIVLAEIAKRVTGEEFSSVTKELFERLGMPNTRFQSNYMAIVPHKARPYSNWNGWREEPNVGNVHGDGALFTTLQDQLKWEQIVQLNDGEYLSQKVISESQAPLSCSVDDGYGYGLEFGRYGGMDYVYHNGSTGAYNATFFRFPEAKVSIVVMTNNRSVPTNYLTQQIADCILELPSDSAPYPRRPNGVEPVERSKDLLGVYQSQADGTIIKIVEKEGSLYRELYQSDPVKLVPEQGGLFAYQTNGVRINFLKVGQVEQEFTLYHPSFKPEVYRKLSTVASCDFDKKELVGNFYNEETDTRISIEFIEGRTYALTKNGKERKAELIVGNQLRMNSYRIEIIRDSKHEVVGLNVNNNRIRNVLFHKT